MELIWSPQAQEQLADVFDYLAQASVEIAERQFRVITTAVMKLEQFPAMGRPGRLGGTRELVISGTPYLAIYRIHADRVQIIALTRGAQLWPRRL